MVNRKILSIVSFLFLVLSLVACSSDADRPDSSASGTSGLPQVVDGDGALIRPFALPLEEFAASYFIVSAIEGTVVDAAPQAFVEDGSPTVGTLITVQVSRSNDPALVGTTVDVWEEGGEVKLRDVRTEIEDVVGRSLTPSELDQSIDYRSHGQAHSKVDDKILVLLTERRKDQNFPTRYLAAVRLKAGEKRDYEWYGEPLNAEWPDKLSPVDSISLMKAVD